MDITNFGYKSSFNKWDELASVRVKPSRELSEEQPEGSYYFSPDLIPILEHPIVKERGEDLKQKILIYQLHTHLNFTETLEHEIVNQVAFKLGTRKYPFELPQEMIEDARKLYVDEAYHFKFSADLASQLERVTQMARPSLGTPRFMRKIHALLDNSPKETKELILLFFSIVSETLITGTLSVIPKDKQVVKAVREVISDHAEDEGRHHLYFSNLLYYIWNQLPASQQKIIGVMLPEFIFGFVEPDYEAIKTMLRTFNLNTRQISTIIEECYPKAKVIEDTKHASKSTLFHFLQAGVFDEKYTREVFLKSKLITESFLLLRK